MALTTKAARYFSGVNWYLLAAKAAILAAALGFAYMQGTHRCEMKNAHAETKAAQIKYVDVVHEVQVRVPVVQEAEQKSTVRRNQVKVSGDKLDEANKGPNAGSCNLSADQLRYFQELARATQH